LSEEDHYSTIEKAVRDVRAETPREPEGPAPSPEEVRGHRERRLQRVTQALQRRGDFAFYDCGSVPKQQLVDLHERLREAEEVERIQDPVLRATTRRVKAFKRGERKVV
jgi:hypothetical protein